VVEAGSTSKRRVTNRFRRNKCASGIIHPAWE
jgi:hypothetical protein